MSDVDLSTRGGDAGAFGVNYALRPHKFVDRRVFVEVLSRYSNYSRIENHIYVGLGSFAMEDHKLINAAFGTRMLISLETNSQVVARQRFNAPLACIKPTQYSTGDFVVRKDKIFREFKISADANSIVWFDMTDASPLRVQLDTFGELLQNSEIGDVVRMTADVDAKILGRPAPDETQEDLRTRRFVKLQELLGDQMKPGAMARTISTRLGIAKLVLHAFRLVAEDAFQQSKTRHFEPVSLTTYADGHRMLSVTGVVIDPARVDDCRSRMHLETVPGGVKSWDELVAIQIPQLTVWEKLTLDREVHVKSPKQLANQLNFRLHDTISTPELLTGYATFQRFYPSFRHVLL